MQLTNRFFLFFNRVSSSLPGKMRQSALSKIISETTQDIDDDELDNTVTLGQHQNGGSNTSTNNGNNNGNHNNTSSSSMSSTSTAKESPTF